MYTRIFDRNVDIHKFFRATSKGACCRCEISSCLVLPWSSLRLQLVNGSSRLVVNYLIFKLTRRI